MMHDCGAGGIFHSRDCLHELLPFGVICLYTVLVKIVLQLL